MTWRHILSLFRVCQSVFILGKCDVDEREDCLVFTQAIKRDAFSPLTLILSHLQAVSPIDWRAKRKDMEKRVKHTECTLGERENTRTIFG